MPTVILLDSSLSMFRPIPSSDATETQTRFSLACSAINTFLDYLNVHAKLEYVALVTFSSSFDVTVPFTREFDTVRTKLAHIEEGDKTCLETALLGVNQLILNEWGSQTPVQTILLTDGCSGVGPLGRSRVVQALPLPPPYPLKIHVLPIAAPHEHSLLHAMPLYQKLVDMASNNNGPVAVPRGAIYCPEQLSIPGLTTCTMRLATAQYAGSWCTLRCGQLEARVQLFPAEPTRTMHVIGFLSAQDLGTPITVSKHLIIPQAQVGGNAPRDNYEPKTPTKEGPDATDEDMSDPSKIPNFCVLLHGALKVEGMCALVSLGAGYGVVAAWCLSARAGTRRSCLLLSVLQSPAPAPWLGDLAELGPDQKHAGINHTHSLTSTAWCLSARAGTRRSCLLLSVLQSPAPAPWLGDLAELGPDQKHAGIHYTHSLTSTAWCLSARAGTRRSCLLLSVLQSPAPAPWLGDLAELGPDQKHAGIHYTHSLTSTAWCLSARAGTRRSCLLLSVLQSPAPAPWLGDLAELGPDQKHAGIHYTHSLTSTAWCLSARAGTRRSCLLLSVLQSPAPAPWLGDLAELGPDQKHAGINHTHSLTSTAWCLSARAGTRRSCLLLSVLQSPAPAPWLGDLAELGPDQKHAGIHYTHSLTSTAWCLSARAGTRRSCLLLSVLQSPAPAPWLGDLAELGPDQKHAGIHYTHSLTSTAWCLSARAGTRRSCLLLSVLQSPAPAPWLGDLAELGPDQKHAGIHYTHSLTSTAWCLSARAGTRRSCLLLSVLQSPAPAPWLGDLAELGPDQKHAGIHYTHSLTSTAWCLSARAGTRRSCLLLSVLQSPAPAPWLGDLAELGPDQKHAGIHYTHSLTSTAWCLSARAGTRRSCLLLSVLQSPAPAPWLGDLAELGPDQKHAGIHYTHSLTSTAWCLSARAGTRRSCLLLSVLQSPAPAPWLGDLAELGPDQKHAGIHYTHSLTSTAWCLSARAGTRRSCLLLSVLQSPAPAPWLGDLAELGPDQKHAGIHYTHSLTSTAWCLSARAGTRRSCLLLSVLQSPAPAPWLGDLAELGPDQKHAGIHYTHSLTSTAWCLSARAGTRRSCLLLSVLQSPAPAPWLGDLAELGPDQKHAGIHYTHSLTSTAWCLSARAGTRRSCLLLSVLQSPAPAPWLGDLAELGPDQKHAEPFPLRASRSYSAGGGAGGGWSRSHALLADVQKVLRHARKLPDKTQHLFKELNRLRRAAISLGFSELLAACAAALQREAAALPPAPPAQAAGDARAQLQHAAAQLTEPRTALDIKVTLQPLPTSYTGSSGQQH